MGLGFSFGKKKGRSTTTGTLTNDESTTQGTNSTQTGTQTSTGSTSSSGSSTGTSSSSTAGTVANTETRDSVTESISRSLSDQTLAGLESVVGNLLGNAGQSAGVARGAIQDLSGFDANSFVDSSVRSAEARTQSDLDRNLGGLSDRIGSAEGNNSMAMLLANRARNDAAASVEGVRANATAQAQQITRENAAGRVAAAGSENSFLGNLLESLTRGQQTTTQVGNESSTGAQATTGTSENVTSENNSNVQNTQSTQQLTEILNQLLTGRTQSVGTENSSTRNSSGGFGLSLGL